MGFSSLIIIIIMKDTRAWADFRSSDCKGELAHSTGECQANLIDLNASVSSCIQQGRNNYFSVHLGRQNNNLALIKRPKNNTRHNT